MYVPAQFKEDRVPVLHEAIREIAFGTLVTLGPDGLIAYADTMGDILLVNANTPGAAPTNLTAGMGRGGTTPAWAPSCTNL